MTDFSLINVFASPPFHRCYRFLVQGKSYNKFTRCDGKVVVITGGNTGIGIETAVELATRKVGRLIC
jgi:hypothetical protein